MGWMTASNSRAFVVLFTLAFGLRILVLTLIPPDLIPPNPRWEDGAVATSLAQGGPFSDPYMIPTGPTAHVPPLWPWAMSRVYRLFGLGFLGGLIRWLLVMGISASLWASLPWLGDRLGMPRSAGFLGGVAGAFWLTFPSEVEPSVALALLLMVGAFAHRWQGDGPGVWSSLFLGVGMGVSFHLRPAVLPVALGFLAYETIRVRPPGRWLVSGALTLGMILACLPWGYRNYTTFHRLYFVRSNFGLELAVGNHPGAHPDIDVSAARRSFVHPRTDLAEARRVQESGEAEYMAEKEREAVTWIRENPGTFLRLTGMRFLYFWFGPLHRSAALGYSLLTLLALGGVWRFRRMADRAAWWALVTPLITYPVVFYIVAYMPRYGEPVRWILFLLAGLAVQQLFAARLGDAESTTGWRGGA